MTEIAAGASPDLGHAIAVTLSDVLRALPGSTSIPMELVAPSARLPASELAIEQAFAKTKQRLAVRLQDAIKEQGE